MFSHFFLIVARLKGAMGKTFRNEEVISLEEVHTYNGWGHSRKHRHILAGYRLNLKSKKPTRIDCIPEAYEGRRILYLFFYCGDIFMIFLFFCSLSFGYANANSTLL